VFDTQLGLLLQQHRHDHPGVRHFFLVVTQFASVWLMVSLTLLMALVLLIRQRRMLALVWVLALVACGLLNLALKEVFSRDRPPFHDVAIHETTESFPSGHSMGAITAYGLLAFMAVQSRLRRRIRTGIVLTLALLILAIGFSRIYLGAHYFSDVIGGLTVGGAWLIACLSGLEVARRRMTNKEEEVKDEG
jgi:undecaprenyl-diphosphatase